MKAVSHKGKTYHVDSDGFLIDSKEWDEGFVECMTPEARISALREDHWKVISLIRDMIWKTGRCPSVSETCRAARLDLGELQKLFPAGYLRGACKLAGLTYREGYVKHFWVEAQRADAPEEPPREEKVYRVDARGFLVDPAEWDKNFAIHLAFNLKVPGGLSAEHWKVIFFLRRQFAETGKVPTVFETCAANGLGLDELERLFPDGYHRGPVRLAGLRVR